MRDTLLLREAQLSQAQRMAGMASWEWYFGGTQIRWSPEMYQFWGYAPGEIDVNLDNVAQATHLDDLPILQTAVGRALQGEDVEMEYRRFDKQGREIFIHTIGQIIRNEVGEAIGVFGIDMNITKRKQQEQRLLDMNRELAEKNRELEQRNVELSAFSYVASHDLQEPLRKIKSFNQLILEQESGTMSAQGQEYFRRSSAAADRMQQLIRDLIAYSKINVAEQTVEPVDLAELVAEVCSDSQETIMLTAAKLHVGTLPSVFVIRFSFRQLLDNLIGNALKYHLPDQAPDIAITYEQVADEAGLTQHELTVADRGIGFDPIYSERILHLFKRLHTQQHYSGTGIGLAICQRVMHNHGGTLTATGTPGKGATFTMRWPMQ